MGLTLKTRFGGRISCVTDSIADLDRRLPYYDDIVFLDVTPNQSGGYTMFPERLPKSLQVLTFVGNAFTTLPPLPSSLRALCGSKNKLTQIPDLSQLEEIEIIDLSSNNITSVENFTFPKSVKTVDLSDNIIRAFSVTCWPEHLVELNLSINRLIEIDDSLDSLNDSCVVRLAHNDFPSQKHNAYTVWIDPETESQAAMEAKFRTVARFTRFGIDVRMKTVREPELPAGWIGPDAGRTLRDTTRHDAYRGSHVRQKHTTYDNSQNVHASSIQTSTNSAVAWLMKNAKTASPSSVEQELDLDVNLAESRLLIENQREEPVWKKVTRAWRPKHFYQICQWLRTRRANKVLARDANEGTVHSVHGLTYGQLIELIWHAIEHHEHRFNILDVLKQEIIEGERLCFTGRFTRALNALSGFIPEVSVEISQNEQMTNRIVQALRGLLESLKNDSSEKTEDIETSAAYETQGRQLVTDILREFNVPTAEWAVWLNAV